MLWIYEGEYNEFWTSFFIIHCSKSCVKFWLFLQWTFGVMLTSGVHCKSISNYLSIIIITFYSLTRTCLHWLPSETFSQFYFGEEKYCPCSLVCQRKGQWIFVTPKSLWLISVLDWFKDGLNYEVFLGIDVPWDLF